MDRSLLEPATPANRSLIGYARVSTADQDPAGQVDALDQVGCVRVFVEHASGAKTARPKLSEALDFLVAGDTLCVWRLDRLGRSLKHLLELAADLEERGIALRSLTEGIDTSTAGGRLVLHIFGSIAEFERELIRERTHAGLAAARVRGRKGGRRPKLTAAQVRHARALLEHRDENGQTTNTYKEVAESLGVARATLYRALGTRTPSGG